MNNQRHNQITDNGWRKNTIGKALIWMSVLAAVALTITGYYVPHLEQIAEEEQAPLTVLQSMLFSFTHTLQQSGLQLLGFLAISTCAGIILCLLSPRPNKQGIVQPTQE